MISETDDLEQELQRNLKLRRELGGEIRLELLIERAATKGASSSRPARPKDEGTFSDRLVGAAWIILGAVGLALGIFIAVWLT